MMNKNGGAALSVGIWYQSLGALTSIVSNWEFDGTPGNIHSQCSTFTNKPLKTLIVEYFDMDAAVETSSGLQLIQFKASSQQQPKPFFAKEVKEIFQNATQAILRHQETSNTGISNFIVASNRPEGEIFTQIQAILKKLKDKKGKADYQDIFEKVKVPDSFFSKSENEDNNIPFTGKKKVKTTNSSEKTILDYVKHITWGKCSDWNVTRDKCLQACLTALETFVFASAKPDVLTSKLHTWLMTWGLLNSEHDNIVNTILGKLQSLSLSGDSTDPKKLMSEIFHSPNPVPLSPREVWHDVVEDLRTFSVKDQPTKYLIVEEGLPGWMLNRQDRLQGLPYTFTGDVLDPSNFDISNSNRLNSIPRIFVLVGPGGVGKTGLLHQLMVIIAGSIWNWKANQLLPQPKFIGYPIMGNIETEINAKLEGAIKRWGKRQEFLSYPVDRLSVAADVDFKSPALWIALDGLDELPESQGLISIARNLSNIAQDNPNIRLILTSRQDQYNSVESTLNENGLLRKIVIDEFTTSEAEEAFLKATGGKVKFPGYDNTLEVEDNNLNIAASEFVLSFHQPLFIGVLQEICTKPSGLVLLQQAILGDEESIFQISKEYIYVFCQRGYRRLFNPLIKKHMIFQALKRLAIDNPEPLKASKQNWKEVCEDELDDLIKAPEFRAFCYASGLMRQLNEAWSFEWRHPFVGRNLPRMEENPAWKEV